MQHPCNGGHVVDMSRVEDWENALLATVAQWQCARFSWGQRDCAHFAADIVLALTGVDVAQKFEHLYHSELTAKTLLDVRGGIIPAACQVLGASVAPLTARRGDIVAVKAPQGHALGVVMGAEAVALTTEGLRPFSPGYWQACWRVG